MTKWNGKRFSIYTSDEENVLNMVEELGKQTNHNTDSLDSKTDLHGDHKGTWQGLNKPTMSEEGMRAIVEDVIDNKIPTIETSLDYTITQVTEKYNNLELIKATKEEVDIERKRIDSLTKLGEGSTTGDAELIDARIGADGKTYANLGNAIRTQLKDNNLVLFETEKALDNGIFDIKNIYQWENGYINSSGNYVNANYMKRTAKAIFIPFDVINVNMMGSSYNLHVIEFNSNGEFVKNTDYINKDSFSISIDKNNKYAFCLQYRVDNVTIADLSTLKMTCTTNTMKNIKLNEEKINRINIKPRLVLSVGVGANNSLGSTVCKYTLEPNNSYNLRQVTGNGDTYSLYNFALGGKYNEISNKKYLIELVNNSNENIDFSINQNRFTLSSSGDFGGTIYHLRFLMKKPILKVGEKTKILLDLQTDEIKELFESNSNPLYIVFGYYASLKTERNFNLSFIDYSDYDRKGIVVADEVKNFDVDDYKKFKKTTEEKLNLDNSDIEEIKIVCFGDSLTMGAGWEDSSPDGVRRGYPEFLSELSGINTINCGIGGDKCQDIFARLGSEPIVLNNITIPKDKTKVRIGKPLKTILDRNFNSDLKYNSEELYKINPCLIKGVPCKITQSEENYYLELLERMESDLVINRPAILTTYAMQELRNPNDIYIFYVGQNGGYDDIGDWISQIKRGIEYIGCDKYLVIACQTNTHNETWDINYSKFKKEFRGNFVDIRSYMLEYGLADSGLQATSQDLDDISKGICPQSLKKKGDTVHFNYYGYKIIGNLLYQRLKELYPKYVK